MSRPGSKPYSSPKRKVKGRKSEDEDEAATEVEVPQLEWKVLSEDLIMELAMMEVEEVAKKLSKVLSLQHCEKNLKEAAVLDYFVSGYWFAARETDFTNQQVSAFFTLLHSLLDNLKTNQFSLMDNVLALKELIAGVDLPPSSTADNPLKCFTVETGVTTLRYLHSTLLQHYSLFQFLLSEKQQEEKMNQKLYIEVPPGPHSLCPPPLEESISLELYERCIKRRPISSPQQQKVATVGEAAKDGSGAGSSHLLNVSPEELSTLMENMTKATLASYQDEVLENLKKNEQAISTRLSKLEKNLT